MMEEFCPTTVKRHSSGTYPFHIMTKPLDISEGKTTPFQENTAYSNKGAISRRYKDKLI